MCAENSGLPPIESLATAKAAQIKDKNPFLGVDCLDKGTMGACAVCRRVHVRTS